MHRQHEWGEMNGLSGWAGDGWMGVGREEGMGSRMAWRDRTGDADSVLKFSLRGLPEVTWVYRFTPNSRKSREKFTDHSSPFPGLPIFLLCGVVQKAPPGGRAASDLGLTDCPARAPPCSSSSHCRGGRF